MDPITQALILLALSKLSNKDLEMLQRYVSDMPQGNLGKEVETLRDILQKSVGSMRELPPRTEGASRTSQHEIDLDTVRMMDSILRDDLGMTTIEASTWLIPAITLDTPQQRDLLYAKPRESFDRWIRRLMQEVPADKLLSATLELRNIIQRRKPLAWRLRSPNE